jgi:hypothetical protein
MKKDLTEDQFLLALDRNGIVWGLSRPVVWVTKLTTVPIPSVLHAGGPNLSRRAQLAYLLRQQEQAQAREGKGSKARAARKLKKALAVSAYPTQGRCEPPATTRQRS